MSNLKIKKCCANCKKAMRLAIHHLDDSIEDKEWLEIIKVKKTNQRMCGETMRVYNKDVLRHCKYFEPINGLKVESKVEEGDKNAM